MGKTRQIFHVKTVQVMGNGLIRNSTIPVPPNNNRKVGDSVKNVFHISKKFGTIFIRAIDTYNNELGVVKRAV